MQTGVFSSHNFSLVGAHVAVSEPVHPPGVQVLVDPEPAKRQVWPLPRLAPIAAQVTEFVPDPSEQVTAAHRRK